MFGKIPKPEKKSGLTYKHEWCPKEWVREVRPDFLAGSLYGCRLGHAANPALIKGFHELRGGFIIHRP